MICPGGLRSFPGVAGLGTSQNNREEKSTLRFPPGGAGGWCGVGSDGHGDRGDVEAEIGERLEAVEKNTEPRRGGGVRLRRIGGQGGREGMGGEGSVGRGVEGWGA